MKAILRVLVVWMTLLAVPLQGFASATMSLCAPPAAAAQHHHTGKCAGCATCGSCVSMAPAFVAVIPESAIPSSVAFPVDQQMLPSVCLALPERPPRA